MTNITQLWEFLENFFVVAVLKDLDNVWVLAGLVLVVFTGLLKLLLGQKLENPAIEKLMHKGVNYLFILGLVSIALGFVVPESKNTKNSEINQTISNSSGSAINAARDINLNSSSSSASDRSHQDYSSRVNQQIKDNSGIAINAGRDVSTNIQEK